MTVVEAKGFFNLASAPAVTLNEPFGLFFSAWGMLVPVRFECVKHRPRLLAKTAESSELYNLVSCAIGLSLLAQQVPVVQAGVRIVNQNARKKQNPPKRVKCGCVEDA